jgi:hypothetical protein
VPVFSEEVHTRNRLNGLNVTLLCIILKPLDILSRLKGFLFLSVATVHLFQSINYYSHLYPVGLRIEMLYLASGAADDPQVWLSAQLPAYCTHRLWSEVSSCREVNVISRGLHAYGYNEVSNAMVELCPDKIIFSRP